MKIPSMTPHINVSRSFFHWSEDDDPGFGDTLTQEDVEILLEDYLQEDDRRRYMLRDFFISRFPVYCQSHQVQEEKLDVMNSLMACKTGRLGYTAIYCDTCKRRELRACACGNRNCPSCGYLNEQKWIALRQSEVIPDIPYFHLIFTLPHELTALMYQNQKETLDLLFCSVKETILGLSRKKLKMTPAILMILHTFGSQLSLHYHLHVLVSGGGLTMNKKEFKRCLSNAFFLPVRALKEVYRGKFMDGLKQLWTDKKLAFFNDSLKYRNYYAWKELLNTCYGKDWNVEIRPLAPVSGTKNPPSNGAESTDTAITYFARYTNRTAISDSRILRFNDETIWFKYKDYKGSAYTWKTMVLSAEEFIRRFLTHILPSGFTRIRTAGLLAGCVRKKNLELVNKLLNAPYEESPVRKMSAAELVRHFYGRDVTVCEKCHSKLEIFPRMDMLAAIRFIRAA